jgi:hypothetical protein
MLTRTGRLAEHAHKEAKKRYPNGYSKAQLVETSREIFGGFGQRLGLVSAPQTDEEIMHKRNAMHFIEGNYPLSMSDCDVVGISGGCGLDCPIFKERRCPSQEEMEASR